MNLAYELTMAIKDEANAGYEYTQMADEADRLGLHMVAKDLRSIADDENKHKEMLPGLLNQVLVIRDMVESSKETPGIYWWVRLGDGANYVKFDSPEQAKTFIEEQTGERLSEAKWINAYSFTLGRFTGDNYISLFEGDEDAQPTERRTWGKFK